MILFNINLVLQSELSPEKRKKAIPTPRMKSEWLFDEVDVTVNTEESIFCIPLSYMYAPSFPCRN